MVENGSLMQEERSNLRLIIALVGAMVFHATLLPLALLGFGEREDAQSIDWAAFSIDAPDDANAGDTIDINFALSYTGLEDLRGMGSYRLYLSRNSGIENAIELHHAVPLPEMFTAAPLNESGRPQSWVFEGSQAVALPRDADGPYWLILEVGADVEQATGEVDQTNNRRATPIYINGPQRPELRVDQFHTPTQAVLGGSILIDYAVTNIGEGWAAPSFASAWQDSVVLSHDERLGDGDLELRTFGRSSPLGPGESYGYERMAITLPRGDPGLAYLIITADTNQHLDQSSFVAASMSMPIELIDTRRPDLAIASIFSPQVIVMGTPFPLRWTTINLGSVTTDGPWTDHVYLSRDAVLDDADQRLAMHEVTDALLAGVRRESPPVAITVPLPELEEDAEALAGQWYLIIVADGDDELDEAIFEDNNTFAVAVTLLTPEEAEDPVGDPDDPIRTEVAWIKREALREHMARLSQTVQPAIQAVADPVPDAPLNPDPTPPALPSVAVQPQGGGRPAVEEPTPDPQDRARPLPPMPDAPNTDVAPRPQTPNGKPPREVEGIEGIEGEFPRVERGQETPEPSESPDEVRHPNEAEGQDAVPGEERIESDADPDAPRTDRETDSQSPAEEMRETDQLNPEDNDSDEPSEVMDTQTPEQPSENDEPAEPAETDDEGEGEREANLEESDPQPNESDSDANQDTPTPPASPSEEQDPTSTPRDDAESDPTDNQPERLRLEHGNVLVGRGVRITTSRLRIGGVGSQLTAVPHDTRVRIVFDNQGDVVEAHVLGEGTGYPDWDARLLQSLYRWKAQGPQIDDADPHYAREFDYQFGLLNRRD